MAQAEFTSAEHVKRQGNPQRGGAKVPPLCGRQLLNLFSKASGSDEADDKLLGESGRPPPGFPGKIGKAPGTDSNWFRGPSPF